MCSMTVTVLWIVIVVDKVVSTAVAGRDVGMTPVETGVTDPDADPLTLRARPDLTRVDGLDSPGNGLRNKC